MKAYPESCRHQRLDPDKRLNSPTALCNHLERFDSSSYWLYMIPCGGWRGLRGEAPSPNKRWGLSSIEPHPEAPAFAAAQELACSLAASNPGLPLVVLTATGELTPATRRAVESFAELRVVEPLFFRSISSLRCVP